MIKEKVRYIVERNSFQNFIIGLIILNSFTIGMETSKSIMNSFGNALLLIDKIILAIFVIEIFLKLYAYGFGFFKSGWNVFDFAIVAIALLPASGALAILRSLRIFRSLRLIKNLPRLRFIVESLLLSIPSIGWIFVLLTLVFYVFSVIGTKLFGASFPEWFGTIWASMFSLFQIMTLEGWADIARAVNELYPFANLYFISFILIASYTTLNIFIAIVVNTMSEIQHKISVKETEKISEIIVDENEELRNDIKNLKEQILKLEEKLSKRINI
ncbi:Kef-type K+ transport system protein [Ignavibacterium album JCM 16511]|uniref:Kef-type K+ transport system protein n=1 Tax=Ignavibacterium album (strain DSM 19864 / JCM 16511 / NBRC 101810 / Mat9-16) TaxID=945713 RepID=I0AFK4_IGNAJ|nr:ion transporter [Ignavibacterium album]AFH47761.1 Kef-type K+ transport system protein [Ignavibacterium album JCM 16511]